MKKYTYTIFNKKLFVFLIPLLIATQIFFMPVQAAEIQYDKLSRVKQIEYEDGSSIHYTYDANGNIKEVETDASEANSGSTGGKTGGDGTDGTGGKSGGDGTDGTGSKTEGDGKSGASGGQGSAAGQSKDSGAGSGSADGTQQPDKNDAGQNLVGKKISTKTGRYQITADGKTKTVTFLGAKSAAKKMKLPDTVTYRGSRYKVTKIADNAWKGKTKLKKVTIGKYVTTIGSKAFYGCKSLKKVILKSTSLKKVGKKAFTGTHKKLVVKVPKSKLKSYRMLLKGKGMKKTAKVKK